MTRKTKVSQARRKRSLSFSWRVSSPQTSTLLIANVNQLINNRIYPSPSGTRRHLDDCKVSRRYSNEATEDIPPFAWSTIPVFVYFFRPKYSQSAGSRRRTNSRRTWKGRHSGCG